MKKGLNILFCITFLLFSNVLAQKFDADPKVPDGQISGQVPYELVRANRKLNHPPQITFDDLTGWKVIVQGDADIRLTASVKRIIWHDTSAELYYAGGTSKADEDKTEIDKTTGQIVGQGKAEKSTSASLIPPEPIILKEKFDTAAFWIFGGYYRRAESFDAVPPNLAVILSDSNEKEYRLEFGSIISGNWTIESAYLPAEKAEELQWPLTVKAIEFTELDNDSWSTLYMDSLAFYNRVRNVEHYNKLKPLNPSVIPTKDATMMPIFEGLQTSLIMLEKDKAQFVCSDGNKQLKYIIDPSEGMLNGITAVKNDGKGFKPASEGALKVNLTGTEEKLIDQGKVKSAQIKDNKFIVNWSYDSNGQKVNWQCTYHLNGKTLAADIQCKGGKARGIDFGLCKGLSDPQGVFVPYMLINRISHIYTEGPLIANAEDVFVSVLPDWYQCNFSHFDNTPQDLQNDSIRLLKETYYYSLTDGSYNDLKDRVIITVSDDFVEVLPNNVNKPSPNREKLSKWIYVHAFFPHEYMFRTMKNYGMNKILAGNHGLYLSSQNYQGYASFSNRWQSSQDFPMKDWIAYRDKMKELGFGFSDYTFHPCVHPLNEFWNETMLSIRGDGSYARGWWYGTYAVKMAESSRLARAIGMKVEEFYPTDSTYLDIHSVIGLTAMDYEAGIEGAGTALKTIYGNMDAIAETRKWHGSVIGEGYHRWLYAGIGDADYASLFHQPSKHDATSERPLLVDFDLLKIHPKAHGIMMGCDPSVFFTPEDFAKMKNDTQAAAPVEFYMYVSASLAYGHMGMLGYEYLPPLSRQMQLYAMMLAPQQEYLMDTAELIEYHNGENFVSVSRALKDDTLKVGRVHVRYSKGMDVYVNYNNNNQNWKLTVKGRDYNLPPFGWVITSESGIHSYSTLINGSRVDYVQGPEFTYFLSPKNQVRENGITLKGGLLINRDQNGWTLIPCGWLGTWEKFKHPDMPETYYDWKLANIPSNRGCEIIKIDKTFFDIEDDAAANISCIGSNRKTRPAPLDWQNQNYIQIKPDAQTVKYLIR